LFSALAMVLGLLGSLGVRRRRLWLRIANPAHDDAGGSPTVVQVGGLARSDSGNFTTEFDGLVRRLSSVGSPVVAAPAVDAIGAGKD
jgi:cytochrome c biogenesis protein